MDVAMFSPSSLFGHSSSDDEDGSGKKKDSYVKRKHYFPGGMELFIREFSFHFLNANLVWPGTFAFADWLAERHSWLIGRRVLELGSGTGALSIFLRKSFEVDITTSDFDDEDIEENIAHNCELNGVPMLPHIRHSWGDDFPNPCPNWDLVIASDILLYVKQYPNLIKTLCFLLKTYKPKGGETRTTFKLGSDVEVAPPVFLMSWRRRIGKEDEALFFSRCEESGLDVEHMGSRVYCISPKV
ncbi:protein-lysine methyltransferase METTL21B isoform X1 [Amborella trichopoda]|uniref:Methyltransferase type 12 domain-containing protein n=1 Tax=Amborella trichopoda TaxID=13333 RepID=W1PPS0_AMBTC|nr:protein-lysine methyltransferase METTL21B isoform X1 [Amborella trichopoda]ERN09799.1 hypothetical protein AMTR_s00029p00244360 [Amborella trichopoda]|eukprot:XP_006848218.1 protein-lysine methyltransferase METTL21B isoform X1 [Amborella trichopoda]